jgi:hypothetical protein
MRRLLFTLCALALSCVPASATPAQISGLTVTGWQSAWGSTAYLRIYSSGFTASDGTVVPAGSETNGVYQSVTCSASSSVVTCPTFTVQTNTDALDNQQSNYTGVLFDSLGRQRIVVFSGFSVPTSISSPMTFQRLTAHNRAVIPVRDTSTYNKSQINALISAGAASGAPATTTALGEVKTSATPTDPANPTAYVVGDTNVVLTSDPRIAQKAITCVDVAATDTAAIQAAVTALGTAGGRISTSGTCSFTSSSITFPALTKSLTFEVYGYWRLATTLILPNNVNWVGLGGASPVQFQRAGPTASIIPPSGNIPTLAVRGANTHLLKNLAINSPTGIGIYLDGVTSLGALVTMENVGVQAAPVATSVPLVVDAFFWVWVKDCSFLGYYSNPSTHSYPASIRLTTSNSSYSATGLVYVSDTVLAGYGVKVDSQVVVSRQGNLFLTNTLLESSVGSFLDLDATNGVISPITMDHCEMADTIIPAPLIGISGTGEVRNVLLRATEAASNPLVTPGKTIRNFVVEGSRTTDYTTGWSTGQGQRDYALTKQGTVEARILDQGSRMSPALQPYQALNVTQDVTAWSGLAGSAAVTTGVLAPDGSTTAATLSSASGQQQRRVSSVTLTDVSVGDWFLFGFWYQNTNDTDPPSTGTALSMTSGGGDATLDGVSSVKAMGDEFYARFGTQRWTPVVQMAKVTAAPSATQNVFFSLFVESGKSTNFWMPFVIRIPAGTMSDDEVNRFRRTISNVVSQAPAGSVALFAHQKLYFGKDASLYRVSANLLKTDGGVAEPVVSKTTTYTATAADSTITADATSAGFTVTLPAATGLAGKTYTIKKIDSTANVVTVAGGGTNIDGAATYAGLSAQWKVLRVVSDGTRWIIVSSN